MVRHYVSTNAFAEHCKNGNIETVRHIKETMHIHYEAYRIGFIYACENNHLDVVREIPHNIIAFNVCDVILPASTDNKYLELCHIIYSSCIIVRYLSYILPIKMLKMAIHSNYVKSAQWIYNTYNSVLLYDNYKDHFHNAIVYGRMKMACWLFTINRSFNARPPLILRWVIKRWINRRRMRRLRIIYMTEIQHKK